MRRILQLLFGMAATAPGRRCKAPRSAAPARAPRRPAPPGKRRKAPPAAGKPPAGAGHAAPRRPGRSPSAFRQSGFGLGGGGRIVYHGTPSLEAARSIARHGWIVGNGNMLGDGIYTTTSIAAARSYAGPRGYLIKARLRPGRCATWSTSLSLAFQAWCARCKCPMDTPARTAFLLERDFTTLRDGDVYVVLHRGYRNPAATKVRPPCLRVLEVIDTATARPVRI